MSLNFHLNLKVGFFVFENIFKYLTTSKKLINKSNFLKKIIICFRVMFREKNSLSSGSCLVYSIILPNQLSLLLKNLKQYSKK